MSIRVGKDPKEEEGGNDEGEVAAESLADYEKRINLFVTIAMHMNPNARRYHYKDGLVYNARKAVFAEVMAGISLKKCQNGDCNA